MRHALIAARQAQHWTQADLARYVSVAHTSICQYERGIRNPRPKTLAALARLLNLPSDLLMQDTPDPLERMQAPRSPPGLLPMRQAQLLPSEARMALLALGRLRQKAHGLQIADADLLACRSMGEVQRLAKRQYRRLALRDHPDQRDRRQAPAAPGENSPQFRHLKQAYDWIMAQPASRLLRGWMLRVQSVEVLEHDVEETGIWGMHIEYH